MREDLQRLLLNTGLDPVCVNALLTFESSALQRLHALSSEGLATSMPPRKPPVGALLSAARMIQQIVGSNTLDVLVNSGEGGDVDATSWMVKWRSGDPRKRAFAKALIDTYARRQTDRNIAQGLTRVICEFVDNELSPLLSLNVDHLQPRLNLANELRSRSVAPLVDQWRHVIDYCVRVLSPSDDSLLPILARLSQERGFKVPPRAEALSAKEFVNIIKDINNLDLRWIPGWTCFVNSKDAEADLLSVWNSQIVDAFLSTLKTLHDNVLSNSISLTFNEAIPVICALDHYAKGSAPIAFSEAYPGLKGLHADLSNALNGLREAFNNRGHGELDFCGFLASLARLTAWLQQFGSKPIGSPFDWAERRDFFANYCRSPQQGVAATIRMMELVHRYLQAPIPKFLKEPRRLDLCYLPWAKLALVAQDQISNHLNPMSVDEKCSASTEIPDLPSPEVSEAMRLWPLLAAGLVFSRAPVTPFLQWSDNFSRNVLIDLSVQLGALSRPRLLELLTSSSEKASEELSEILQLQNRAFSPFELSDPSGLVKPDIANSWRSLSQAVLAINHADSTSSHSDGANCSFADWISHQQTLSDLFQLITKLAPYSTRLSRFSHTVERYVAAFEFDVSAFDWL